MSHEPHSPTNGQRVLDIDRLGTLEAVLGEELQEVIAFFCGNLPDMIDAPGQRYPLQARASRDAHPLPLDAE